MCFIRPPSIPQAPAAPPPPEKTATDTGQALGLLQSQRAGARAGTNQLRVPISRPLGGISPGAGSSSSGSSSSTRLPTIGLS